VHKPEREQKLDKAGGGKAREETLAPKLLDLKNKPVRPQTGPLIGAAWSS